LAKFQLLSLGLIPSHKECVWIDLFELISWDKQL